MAEYIEREGLLKWMKEEKPEFHTEHGYLHGITVGFDYALKFVKQIPSADVVEVVHGEWIITEEILETIKECSCCHCKTYYPKPLSFNVRKSPFCEDCGAKMDGKGD